MTDGFRNFRLYVVGPIALWTCGEAVHHGKSTPWRNSFYLLARNPKGKRKTVGPQLPLKAHFHDLRLHTRLSCQQFPLSSSSTHVRTEPHKGLWRIFQIQSVTRNFQKGKKNITQCIYASPEVIKCWYQQTTILCMYLRCPESHYKNDREQHTQNYIENNILVLK